MILYEHAGGHTDLQGLTGNSSGRSVLVLVELLLDDATGLLSAYCRVGDGLLG